MDFLINTRSTLDQQQSDDSRPSINRLICIDQKLVDCRQTVDRDVNGMSTECQLRCHWSVDWGSRASNDTQLWMPSVHMIWFFYQLHGLNFHLASKFHNKFSIWTNCILKIISNTFNFAIILDRCHLSQSCFNFSLTQRSLDVDSGTKARLQPQVNKYSLRSIFHVW